MLWQCEGDNYRKLPSKVAGMRLLLTLGSPKQCPDIQHGSGLSTRMLNSRSGELHSQYL